LSLLRLAVERETEKRRKLQADDKAIGEKVVSHKAGPMLWLRNFTRTEDYQWLKKQTPSKATFPYRPHREYWTAEKIRALPFDHELSVDDPPDYLDMVMGKLLTREKLLIAKTREMITSWIVVAYITWLCQWRDTVEYLSQSEKDEKAQGLIRYSEILYENQEDWLKVRHPLSKDGNNKNRREWENGSHYVALPQGVRQTASFHPYGYFSDEAAHQPEFETTVNVAMPAIKQVICVSSAAPSHFGILCSPHIRFSHSGTAEKR
jgi:hypothetical protein